MTRSCGPSGWSTTTAAATTWSSVQFQTTVTFEDIGGRTRLTMRMEFPSAEERNRVAEKYGAIEGAKQTLGRLADHLAASPNSKG